MPDSISEQDFINWWRDPVGRLVNKMIEAEIADRNATGLTESTIRDPIKAAMSLGYKEALEGLLRMSYVHVRDFMEALEEGI